MSGGGRILEQDDPFADLTPQAKPQTGGEADPFKDLVPKPKLTDAFTRQWEEAMRPKNPKTYGLENAPEEAAKPQRRRRLRGGPPTRQPVEPLPPAIKASISAHADPFSDLIPPPPSAAADATRVGPEPVNLAGVLQEHAPGQSGNLANDIAEVAMEQITHPVESATAMVEQPFKAGMTVGEYGQGRASGKAAAIAAGQTAAVAAGAKIDALAEPFVARVVGERLAPFATRTAIGAGTGALFTPDNPAVGGTLGAGVGALSSRGAYARKLQERIARFEQMAKEHPDWVDHTDRGSTPAEAETRKSHTLANPNGPKATATAEPMAADLEPDFVVEDPVRELGPFKGALVEHGQQFADALENTTATPAGEIPPGTKNTTAPGVEQLRQQESDLFDQHVEANRAAGWPAPSPDALDHFGDAALEISHEETARELWMHASDHYTASEAIAQGVTGRKRDELERVARQSDDAYNGMLSQYEDYFGAEGVQTFLQKTGLPGDLTGGIESIPDARDFNERISTGEPPTRANPDGVPGLVERVSRPAPVPRGNPPQPQAPKKLEAAVKSPFGVVVSVPGKSLQLDPDRFQWKHQGIDSKSGAGAWVKGAKRYNPVLGGVWVTWIDPADGLEYVVNSHHRKAIYDNDITPERPENVNVLRIEAATAQEARAIGARINIAEGHGTALDVAQFIRDSGLEPSDLEKEGISLRGDLARQGSALAQLTPDLLAKVGTGELAENHGVAIGEMLAGKPELQREVVAEVKRSGRRLSADDVREVARQVDAAGTADVRQETLFGGEVGRRPLFIERAQLATSIMKKLGQDRRILGFVAQEQRAQILAKGGNVIDVEKSRELADQSGQLEELFERLYTREGPIAKVLTQAASRVAHGQKVKVVADEIYADVARAVQEEISRGTGSGASDRDAEGPGSVSPGAAETGDLTQEKVEIDPDQEGFGLAEPQMRPEYQESYNRYLAKRKATFLETFRETKSVDKSAAAAGVGPSSVAQWRKKDPEFAAAVDAIAPARKGKLRGRAEKPAENPTARGESHPEVEIPTPVEEPVSTRINPTDLKGYVQQLRQAVIDAGGLVNSRHLRAFNQEAARIIAGIDNAEGALVARGELDELAEDFTPIKGLEEEQREIHDTARGEEMRRTIAKRDREIEASADPHDVMELKLHRQRQARLQAKKEKAAAAPAKVEPINSYVALYREAKAARENVVKESDRAPYPKDGSRADRILAGEGLPAVKDDSGEVWTRKTPAEHGDLIAHAEDNGGEFTGAAGTQTGWILDKKFVSLKDLEPELVEGKHYTQQKPATKYEYSSTQINLPSKAAAAVKKLAADIPDADLAADGREEEPHITIKYGLHGTDPGALKKLLEGEAPIVVTLGKTSYFPNGESGNGDVVKADVDSPELHRLNKKIADALPNTETHPTYKPHATIAYVKPGLGKKYSGDTSLVGKKIKVRSVVFSDKNGNQTRIQLKGSSEQPHVIIFDKTGFLESHSKREIDEHGGHHSSTFTKDALRRQDDKGVLAYQNRHGDVFVQMMPGHGVTDAKVWEVVQKHWPGVEPGDVTVIEPFADPMADNVVRSLNVEGGGESNWLKSSRPAGTIREKDLFGYGKGNDSLFPDEEAGKAGPAKPSAGGFKEKAKAARDEAEFLRKQLVRMKDSPKYIGKTGEIRARIAELERIANFTEKLTTKEIELQTGDEKPAGDDSIDMFKERHGDHIGPDNHTLRIQRLERDLANYAEGIHPLGASEKMLTAKQIPEALRFKYSGIKAGLDRVTKELREQLPATERAGYPSEQFTNLYGEYRELLEEYDQLVTDVAAPTRGAAIGSTEFRMRDDGSVDIYDNTGLYHGRYPSRAAAEKAGYKHTPAFRFPGDMQLWENPSQLHLFYTYGSPEKFVEVAREVVRNSGKFVTMADAHERGQQVLSSRQRRRNLEMAKTGAFVEIEGKKIAGPHDIAQLMFPFRSPETERLSVVITDDDGVVLKHIMTTSGAINYTAIPRKLAQQIARAALPVGGTRVHQIHNHPSGDPTESPEDGTSTMQVAYELSRYGITLVDHVIIDHNTYTWLKPQDVTRHGGTLIVGRKMAFDPPAADDRSDWTQGHGGIIQSPKEVAGLAATALQGEDFGLLYVTSNGQTVALEPRPKGDLDTIQKWLRDALKAHGAAQVALVYNPAEHGDVIGHVLEKLKNFPSLAHGLFDVVPFDGSESLVERDEFALAGFRKKGVLLPNPSKRILGEGRKGYGGRTEGPEGEGEDRSEASNADDRQPDQSAALPEKGPDRGSSKPAELHDPQLERAGGFLAKIAYEVRRILTPAVLTRESAQTARVLRAASGRMAHRRELASHALRQFSREITRLSPENRYAFMHQIETGEKVTTTPGMTAAAAQLRAELDRVRDRVRGLGTGKLENFIENYLPHIYKDPKRARTLIQQMMQRRPLEGNKSWLKKRSIPTLKDAMEIGLEPITDNPIDLALLRIFQMNKYVMAHEIMQELKAKGPEFLKFVGAHEKPPIGYRPIDDSAFTVFGRPAVAVQEAFDPILRGHLVQILERLGGKHGRTINMREWGTAQGSQVKTKFGGDIGVLMHEIGHVLDTKFQVWDKLHEPIESRTVTRGKKKGQSVPTKDAIAYRVKVDKELRELADLRMEGQNPDDVAEHHKKYIRNRAEKIANAIHALVYMPDRMGGVAPTVKAALEQLLQGTPAADILNPKRGVALGTGVAEKGIYGTLITGKYYAPDAVATVINNFLSPGLRGNPIYDAYMGVGNSLNQVQLGLSFFHLGFTSLDAMVSKLALAMQQTARGQLLDAAKSTALFPFAAFTNFAQGFQVYRAYLDPERAGKYDQVIAAIERAGGKIKMDDFYKNDHWKKLVEGAVHHDPITVVARLPLAAFELSSKFILEFVVPRQKLGVFADMFMMEAKRLGPDATEDELRRAAQKAWDSTDNRMGQMVYDNLMWHRVLKDTLMGLVRAVGWDLGTFRELLGGGRDLATLPVKTVRRLSDRRQKLLPRSEGDEQHQDRPDPLFTHKAAYVLALFAGVGALGAALNKGMTGEWPQDMRDIWTPRTGKTNDEGNPERVELPSYVKDVFAYVHHPVQTALHKLHPLLNYITSILQNEDYYGNMVKNPDDDALTQLQQELKYAIEQWQPFGFRNASEQAKRNQSKAVQIGNFFGITPAHRSDTRTPAENKMADLLRKKGRSGLTPEESDQRQLAGELRTAKKLRKPKGTAIADAMRGRQTYADKIVGIGPTSLSHRDAERVWMGTGRNTQLEQFKRLEYPEAKQVMDLASPEERRRWHSVFVQKRANYSAEHGAAAMRAVK